MGELTDSELAVLDAEVHTQVFGAEIRCSQGLLCNDILPYSSEIEAAWVVVDWLLDRPDIVAVDVSGQSYDKDEPRSYACLVTFATPLDAALSEPTRFEGIDAEGTTPALAICRAALKSEASARLARASAGGEAT